ncbi:hypothetical protein T12_3063 [Trichinella patagoniensis]|uniref:Uncharacterized protein n=1 Tax=Trichinella patagoniensis TaxID=990121 RepID=A0A0V0ZXH3_9BILA|nr:hypothetical protein T12_3063 [Trichinella patagoniensis]
MFVLDNLQLKQVVLDNFRRDQILNANHSQEQRATELNSRNIADKQLFSKMIREILQLKKSCVRAGKGARLAVYDLDLHLRVCVQRIFAL